MKLEKWSYIVTIIGLPILLVSVWLAFFQIREVYRVAASQNDIALNSLFYTDTNVGIMGAIDYGYPVLTEHGGRYTKPQLDKYLGDYDVIDQAFSEGFLTEDEMCNSFSYYASTTVADPEIKQYMQRPENQAFYDASSGIIEIANNVRKYCN